MRWALKCRLYSPCTICVFFWQDLLYFSGKGLEHALAVHMYTCIHMCLFVWDMRLCVCSKQLRIRLHHKLVFKPWCYLHAAIRMFSCSQTYSCSVDIETAACLLLWYFFRVCRFLFVYEAFISRMYIGFIFVLRFYSYACIHTYMHAYIPVYTYTHAHIHTHTHSIKCSLCKCESH